MDDEEPKPRKACRCRCSRCRSATPAVVIGIVAGLFTITGLHVGERVVHLTWLSSAGPLAHNILREHGVFSALFS